METGTGLAPIKTFREFVTNDPFRALQQRFNRMFGEGPLAFPADENLSFAAWSPACDIFETADDIVVKAELPGIKKEDVKLTIENNVLTLRGERKFEAETKKENYYRVEQSYGEFSRSFTLPTSVDLKNVNAEFKDGVLSVKLPKREEAKPKAIEVNVK